MTPRPQPRTALASIADNASAATIDDGTLMARIAGGDLEALGLLFDRYVEDVRRCLLRLGVSDFEVDDLVQLTFLDVPRSAARFEAGRGAKAWLLGMASMHVRRHRRSMARWVKRIAGRAFEENRPRPRQPDELLGSRQDQARFYAALETLSDKKREVFVLVNLEGVSSEEVASALGIPVATVWTRLHHARKALRAALDDTPKEARNPRDEQG